VKRVPELTAHNINMTLAQPKQPTQEKVPQKPTDHLLVSEEQHVYLSDWKPLESMEEMSLFDIPAYSRLTSLNNLIQEQALEGSDPTPLQFSIPVTKYHIMPYPAYFDFRIDAREARWNAKLKKWILYDAEKRYWDIEKGLYKIQKLADGYVLNEVTDEPHHILIKKKPMDRLTFGEGTQLITSLQRARKKWRGFAIDLYANKIAFQLSTFLIVLVGLSLG